MSISLHHGDLLTCKADAVLFTTDGTAPGLEGTIARAFAKRYPHAWKSIVEEFPFPMGLGATESFEVENTDSRFHPRTVVMASTLHHLDSLSTGEKLAVIRSALRSALDLAKAHQADALATAVLSGGWRLQPEKAAMEMFETYFRASVSAQLPALQIYLLDESLLDKIVENVSSKSYLTVEKLPNSFAIAKPN